MTIEQEDTIVHPFVLRQFLHDAASRRISQDGRSQKFHLGELCHLDFWEQFVEAVDYTREFFRCKANVDYLGLLRVNYEAYPLKPSVQEQNQSNDHIERRSVYDQSDKMCSLIM